MGPRTGTYKRLGKANGAGGDIGLRLADGCGDGRFQFAHAIPVEACRGLPPLRRAMRSSSSISQIVVDDRRAGNAHLFADLADRGREFVWLTKLTMNSRILRWRSERLLMAWLFLSRLGDAAALSVLRSGFPKRYPKYPKPRTFVSQVIPSIHEHLCGVNTPKHVCSGEFGPGVLRVSVEGVMPRRAERCRRRHMMRFRSRWASKSTDTAGLPAQTPRSTFVLGSLGRESCGISRGRVLRGSGGSGANNLQRRQGRLPGRGSVRRPWPGRGSWRLPYRCRTGRRS